MSSTFAGVKALNEASKEEVVQPITACIPNQTTTYFLSPETLRQERCRCTVTRDPPQDAAASIKYMLRRLDKLWTRMRQLSLEERVRVEGERVLLELRKQGLELFHLVGQEIGPDQGKAKRQEYSIIFMVPSWSVGDSDATEDSEERVIGHRPVAEILIHLRPPGRHKEVVENVAVRFPHAWQDWTVSIPHNFFRIAGSPPMVKIDILNVPVADDGHQISAGAVIEDLRKEIIKLIGPSGQCGKRELYRCIGRATEVLNADGLLICGFKVESVRRATTGDLVQTIRAAVMVKKAGSLSMTETKQSTSNQVEPDEEGHGAVILMDIGGRTQRIVKHITVVYQGEWPVGHSYRKDIPPTSLSGLERSLLD